MGVRIGCGLSEHPEARPGAVEAAVAARRELGDADVDLAIVFASGAHLAAPEATVDGVLEALAPAALVGCGAGGVLGRGREVEAGTAVAVWAASFGGEGSAEVFHATATPTPEGVAVEGLPAVDGASAILLLPDPYSFPTDVILAAIGEAARGVPILGGLSSARTLEGSCALFAGERVHDSGAVGVRFAGLEVLPCVSQGAAPVGPELIVSACDGHVVHELDGRPALEALREAIEELPARERILLSGGLLLGIAVESPTLEHADDPEFLVRAVLGADPEAGTITIGAPVDVGQIIRLHVRDAGSAAQELHESLSLRRTALGGRPPAGTLVFTCNGRGRAMFGVGDHDATALADELGNPPSAGFFAAGEIGPVAGSPFLHGFTATVAVFGG